MNCKKINLGLIILFYIFSLFYFQVCLAATPDGTSQCNGGVCLTNPLTGTQSSDSPALLLGKIISYVMGLIGSLALVMFIYGGATWMLSGGSQERVAKGKSIVIWASLGIGLILTSYVLVRFVVTAIGGSVTP